MSEEIVIRFGEIMDFHEKNWDAYQKLLQNPYVIFVGAGLSAGIGNGNWTQLLYDVANKIFRKKLDDNSFSILEIVNEKNEITSEDKKKADEYIKKLKALDDSSMDGQNMEKRIKLLRKIAEEKRYGSIVEMLFCLIKNEDWRDYAYYEAGELLKLYGGKTIYYQSVEEAVDEQKPETGKWLITPEHAVYWLPEIVRKENDICCKVFTTNFDQIIECALELRSTVIETSKIKVVHLHGEHRNACLALSDLYELYQKELEKHPRGIPGILKLQEDDSRRYLFLGTSFSEHHIANAITKLMSSSSSNMAIYPVPENIDRQFNFELAEKIKDFKLDNVIRYSNNHNHKELVIVLRQLARDLQYGFWNNELLMQFYFENQVDLCECPNVNKAVQEFENDKDELLVRIGSKVNRQEEGIILNSWEEVQYLLTKINVSLPRPDWSKCFIPEAFLQKINITQTEGMLQPLGSSIYILLEKEEDVSDATLLEKVRNQIKKYNKKYNCKLITIILNDMFWKNILSSLVSRYCHGNYYHRERTFARNIEIEISQLCFWELKEILDKSWGESVNKDINNVEDNKVRILRQEENNGNNL